jgi:hypothetical protein
MFTHWINRTSFEDLKKSNFDISFLKEKSKFDNGPLLKQFCLYFLYVHVCKEREWNET